MTNPRLTGLAPNDAPRLARERAVENGAAAFYRFALQHGADSQRLDLRRKVEQAQDYTIEAGGSSFAVPTKLKGTKQFQATLAALGAIPHRYRKLVARVVPDTRPGHTGESRLALAFGGDRVGYVQDKHRAWLLPMLTTTRTGQVAPLIGVGFYALQVTGGEPGRPTRGLNVVVTGAGERAALLMDHESEREAEGNFYETEAMLEAFAEEAELMDAAERGHELF